MDAAGGQHARRLPADGERGEGQVDADRYVRSLLDTVVLTAREVADPNEILEPDFPLAGHRTAAGAGHRAVRLRELPGQAYPEAVPGVAVAVPVVLSMWPQEHDLALYPRTPQQLGLPADHVQMLLLWADEGEGTGQ